MNNLLKIFIGICTIHLGLELVSSEWTLLSKPLLMPTLGLYLLSENSWSSKYIKSLLLALLFSTIGDGLLMFTAHDQLYFIAGLASFLVAHLFYVFFFLKNTKQKKLNPKRILVLGIYLFLFIYLLHDGLTGLLLYAVPVYACILAWMTYTAMQYGFEQHKKIKLLFLGGAILFMLSDSLIGLFAFTEIQTPLWTRRISIMLSYVLAQYLLISGANLSIQGFPSKKN
jgi:uncharacterized membrane protein YhhN